jgi:hypothetical protein
MKILSLTVFLISSLLTYSAFANSKKPVHCFRTEASCYDVLEGCHADPYNTGSDGYDLRVQNGKSI